MPKTLLLSLSALLAMTSGCYDCRSQCDDYLEVIPTSSFEAGAFPATDTYQIEILVDASRFECSGYFEGEGEDVWTCSEGVEAHSRFGWKMPTFVIAGGREAKDIHVKIWREGVVILDDAVDIYWQRSNDASTDIQPCENLGCWAGIIRPIIPSFDGLPEGEDG